MVQKIKAPALSGARPLQEVMQRGSYLCPELRPYEGRPNAMDAHNLPSLINGKRVWRDGRTEEITQAQP